MKKEIEIEEHQLSVLYVGGVVTVKVPMEEAPDFVMKGQPYKLLPSFCKGEELAACRMRWPFGEKGTAVMVRSMERAQKARVLDSRVIDCLGGSWLVALEGL